MKILDIDGLVLERIKVQPVTNAELEQVKKDYEKTLVKPGDELKDRDYVLVAIEHSDGSDVELTYTYYDDFCNYLICPNMIGINYEFIRDTFTYVDDSDKSTYYIVKIYRCDSRGDNNITISGGYENVTKKLESSIYWKCVYKNDTLLNKFNIS